MSKALKLHPDASIVSHAGTEYKPNKDGIIQVSDSHFGELQALGFKTPEQYDAEVKRAEALVKEAARIAAAAEAEERQRQLNEARLLLESAGMKISSK
jgi:hypothetical protein